MIYSSSISPWTWSSRRVTRANLVALLEGDSRIDRGRYRGCATLDIFNRHNYDIFNWR